MSLWLNQKAPYFEGKAVVNGKIKTISLNDYAEKYLVLFFYPADFTFVCPTEIIAFSERIEEFSQLNCEVVACSTDTEYSHLAWISLDRNEGGLGPMKIPLLADSNARISRAYDVLNEDEATAFRGLYIIDRKGLLRQIIVNDNSVGRSVDEVLRLVKALQFVEVHGEMCSSNWKPGHKGIDVKEMIKHFSTK